MYIDKYRELGKEALNTQGSSHYKTDDVEPLDLIFSFNMGQDFCLGNIIKYASRFKRTQNLKDLQKLIDYAVILYGYKQID